MSSSDDEEYSSHSRSQRFPFHDAAEEGDIETLRYLFQKRKLALFPTPPPTLPLNDVQPREISTEKDTPNNDNEKEKMRQQQELEVLSDEEMDDSFVPETGSTSNICSDSEQSVSETKEESSQSNYTNSVFNDPDDLDNDNCTALHVSLLNQNIECAKLLLENGSNPMIRCEGSTVLHLAAAQGAFNQKFSIEALKMLLDSTTLEATARDDRGQSLLHVAALCGDVAVTEFILTLPSAKAILEIREIRQCKRVLHFACEIGSVHVARLLIDAHRKLEISLVPLDILGRTPLHGACRLGRWEVADMLQHKLQQSYLYTKDKLGLTPGDLAVRAVGGNQKLVPSDLITKLIGRVVPASQNEEEAMSPTCVPKSTAIFFHKTCEEHFTCHPISRAGPEPPPENINRLKIIYNKENGVLRARNFEKLEWFDSSKRAQIGDILRVHDYSHVERVRKVCQQIEAASSMIAHLDGDTAVSHLSYDASLRAAGAAIDAVDQVCGGQNQNAFCAIRPPGHHAGFRGKTILSDNDKDGSHGFCLLNNVAIAAAYARCMYRKKGIERIAIVDFDVHHGNGTEDCIRNLVPSMEEATISTPFSQGIIKSMKYRPWLNEGDANNVLFISSHGYGKNHWSIPEDMPGGWFYPGSGKSCVPESEFTPPTEDADELYEYYISSIDKQQSKPLILNVGLPLHRRGISPGLNRHELRMAYRNEVFPRIDKFQPDLILISAGFDAHHKDSINYGYIGLCEEDYYWITEQLVCLANSHCQGRIVSVLEGGYRIQGGPVSAFGRSVAHHVQALLDGCTTQCIWDSITSKLEGELETSLYEEREAQRQQKRQLEREQQHAALKAVAQKHLEVVTHNAGSLHEKPDEPTPSRSKRKRIPVDYAALAKKIKEEEISKCIK